MHEIFCGYDIYRDAWNWQSAVNSYTNATYYKTMNNKAQDIFEKIKGLSKDEANKILIPFLEKNYEDNREEIDDAVKQIKIKLDMQKDQIFELMEKLTKRPIFNERFQIRYTTCIRGPYNRKNGEIWTFDPLVKTWRLRAWSCGFTHELLHFQTHKYYENEYPMNQLNH